MSESTRDEVAAHHIHVTHAGGVGSEGGDHLHGVRVVDVHLQGGRGRGGTAYCTHTHTHTDLTVDVSTAGVLLGGLQ